MLPVKVYVGAGDGFSPANLQKPLALATPHKHPRLLVYDERHGSSLDFCLTPKQTRRNQRMHQDQVQRWPLRAKGHQCLRPRLLRLGGLCGADAVVNELDIESARWITPRGHPVKVTATNSANLVPVDGGSGKNERRTSRRPTPARKRPFVTDAEESPVGMDRVQLAEGDGEFPRKDARFETGRERKGKPARVGSRSTASSWGSQGGRGSSWESKQTGVGAPVGDSTSAALGKQGRNGISKPDASFARNSERGYESGWKSEERNGRHFRESDHAPRSPASNGRTRSRQPEAETGFRKQGSLTGFRASSRKVEEDETNEAGSQLPPRPWPRTLGAGEEGMCWRLFNVEISVDLDPGKDDVALHPALHAAVAARFGCKAHHLPRDAIQLVRKSFDARKGLKFVYAVDVDERELFAAMRNANASAAKLRAPPQHLVRMAQAPLPASVSAILGLPAERSNTSAAPLQEDQSSDRAMASRRASHSEASPSQGHSAGGGLAAGDQMSTGRRARGKEWESGREASSLGASSTGASRDVGASSRTSSREGGLAGEGSSSASQSGAGPQTTPLFESDFSGPGRLHEDLPVTSESGCGPSGVKGRMGRGRGAGARVVVVGSGPAGLFAALVLAEAGHRVVLLERGQPVEVRGRDIGALMVRRQVDANSNFCYGEGGAGTWSDGKLTTRIGKNSTDVQAVLRLLVQLGAPERILLDGKPHLGTDRLVRILRSFRHHLLDLGVDIRFGTAMEGLEVRNGQVAGVAVGPVPSHPMGTPSNRSGASAGSASMPSANGVIPADKVVLAVGHSARDVYAILQQQRVQMSAKDFAVGFRVEHPQELINQIQYGRWSEAVARGKGRVPVADYSLAAEISAGPSEGSRGCYSFCMCPGGQVVPTSTNEEELCVNGMSFSSRSSKWANAALVTSVTAADFEPYMAGHGALAGVAFQRAMEREAAAQGGGAFVAPVQRVADFLEGRLSDAPLPSSSYRLGVRSARLDQIYPPHITLALRKALLTFDRQLPGFLGDSGLLHGVETRTSAPVRVERHRDTYESVSLPGLYPVGEGAGYAGGIVSAAVDGMKAGLAIARELALGAA